MGFWWNWESEGSHGFSLRFLGWVTVSCVMRWEEMGGNGWMVEIVRYCALATK